MNAFVSTWASDDLAISDRYEAWTTLLSETYGRWEAAKPARSDFFGSVKRYDDSALKVVDCVCDPCSAIRTRADIRADGLETITVQAVLSGKEIIDLDGEKISLSRGDLLIWDSTKPMSFEVQRRLHKISVVLPLPRFLTWLPRSKCVLQHSIAGNTNSGRLLTNHVKSLSASIFDGGCNDNYALIDSTIGVLINALGDVGPLDSAPLRVRQLRYVKRFIVANIRNPLLSPAVIAGANGISLRYLHWLFEFQDETVNQYVFRKRLEFCARDLSNTKMRSRKISDIAFYWGFQDITHFSKKFREQYSASAKTYRARSNEKQLPALFSENS